jgi:hypothetical protein
MQVSTFGLDLGKHVFQVHGVDAMGQAYSAAGFTEPKSPTFC